MAYGILKVDTITFTDDGVDKSVSISGLVQNPTFSGNITVTGTVSGDIIQGQTVSGVTVTGTTANFASGVFTTGVISGSTYYASGGVIIVSGLGDIKPYGLYSFPNATGVSGYVLSTNSDGTTSWITPLADGDKGDITVSAGGTVWTIDSGVVTTAQLGGDITTAGKALLDDADTAAQRSTLGLVIGTDVQAYDADTAKLDVVQTFTAVQTLTDPAIIGTILEDVYTITDGAAFEVDPGNGSVQLITLGASRTPKATNFAAGEAVTLMIDDGTAYTLTWTDTTWGTSGVIWTGGSAPTLATTGYTVVQFWKVGSQVYGARVGDVA